MCRIKVCLSALVGLPLRGCALRLGTSARNWSARALLWRIFVKTLGLGALYLQRLLQHQGQNAAHHRKEHYDQHHLEEGESRAPYLGQALLPSPPYSGRGVGGEGAGACNLSAPLTPTPLPRVQGRGAFNT